MYINWFTCILFFVIVYAIQKIRGNENSPNSLNITVNYYYHSKNRVITRYFPSMRPTGVMFHEPDNALNGGAILQLQLALYDETSPKPHLQLVSDNIWTVLLVRLNYEVWRLPVEYDHESAVSAGRV